MDDNVKLSDEFTPLRDRIAEVVYVRDRFDGPPTTTADAILAMPEMQALLRLYAAVGDLKMGERYDDSTEVDQAYCGAWALLDRRAAQ